MEPCSASSAASSDASTKVVSLTRSNDDPPFEDVLPHCDDYLSAAHIERLLRAKLPAQSEPRDESGQRYGIRFFTDTEVPTGFLDDVAAKVVKEFCAFGTPSLPTVAHESDDEKKMHIFSVRVMCTTSE